MNKLACLSGRFGRPGIVFIGVAALWWLITRYGAFLGAETRRDQILLLILLSLGLLFVCYLPVMKKYVQELTYRRRARKEQRLPDDEERRAQTPPRYVTVQDIRHTLRRQYGRFWGRKIRILLITGTASEVELLTPGLTEQFWQEEQGTLLLWGGEPSQPENA
ncbi:type VI secretion protein VasK, partial [Escherichia coli]